MVSTWFERFPLLVLLLSLGACSDLLDSRSRVYAVNVRVDSAFVHYDADGRLTTITAEATVRNDGGGSVLFPEWCGTVMERATDSGWEQVWLPICVGEIPSVEVLPSSEQRIELAFHNLTTAPERWRTEDPMPGEYRIQVYLHDGERNLPEDAGLSQTFRFQGTGGWPAP